MELIDNSWALKSLIAQLESLTSSKEKEPSLLQANNLRPK